MGWERRAWLALSCGLFLVTFCSLCLLEFQFCACVRSFVCTFAELEGSLELLMARVPCSLLSLTAVSRSATSINDVWCQYHSEWSAVVSVVIWGISRTDVVYSLWVHCYYDGISTCILVSVYLFWVLVCLMICCNGHCLSVHLMSLEHNWICHCAGFWLWRAVLCLKHCDRICRNYSSFSGSLYRYAYMWGACCFLRG